MHHADSMTLEVRISNTVAQNLYASLGFEVAGRRKKYYMDTGEDGPYHVEPTAEENCRRP